MKKLSVITTNSLIYFFVALVVYQTNGQERPPNILWIVSEDNSPLLGSYGDEFATTPHLDQLASEGILYENAFATAPVCAPARSTLITGLYSTSMGTQHMRSNYPIPNLINFFPHYLKKAGYYTSNNAKKDYNTNDQPKAWDESSKNAHYKNREPGQPFFAVFNSTISHESSLHSSIPSEKLKHKPEEVSLPPYHPDTPDFRHDWAQYYDKIENMDKWAGKILQELETAGLADNTIVFYFSDHGGVLGRSKRFMYESGLRVPLIIRFPTKYKNLAPDKPGSRTDRLVTFADFGPTVLSLADISVPNYMQGEPFLGKRETTPLEFAFSFRGRMDERIDMVRSVRNKKYRYIRNYMPHKPYSQYLEYLWKAPSMQSWEKAFKDGALNEIQEKFWKSKPVEELFDVEADPHNVNNLADQPKYKDILLELRKANRDWLLESRDIGFIPEAMMIDISKKKTLYKYARSKKYPLERIINIAEVASSGDVKNLKNLKEHLHDQNAIIRYWAATGFAILGEKAKSGTVELRLLLNDPEESVRIAAAEALYSIDKSENVLSILEETLKSDNLMVRVQALNVLESMGPDATPALSSIKNLLRDNRQGYDTRAAQRIIDKL